MGDYNCGGDGGLSTDAATALLHAAIAARENAYAPYSGFPVGAALLDASGRVFSGVNVENAAYPLSTCAERAAVVGAIAHGAREFRAIAIAGPDVAVGCPPCGSCRQVLHEFGPEMMVVLAGPDGTPQIERLSDLLPRAFGADRLDGKENGRP